MKTMIALLILALFLLTDRSGASMRNAKRAFYSTKSNSLERLVIELVDSKYFFSAISFAKRELKRSNKLSKEFSKAFETIVLKTGTESFLDLDLNILKKHNDPTISFIHGLKLFNQKRYKSALSALTLIGDDNRFSPEAQYIIGTMAHLKNNIQRAKFSYQKCKLSSEIQNSSSSSIKMKRYYKIIEENCTIHIARLQYESGDFTSAISSYDSILKVSYRWPYTLIEKAWANFQQKDYNRTLGLLVTYKSPLLSSYFFPEAEILTALSYFNLCLWSDAEVVINNFYNVYRKKSDSLKAILTKHKKSNSYFINLALTSTEDLKNKNPYIINIITQVRKSIKFNLDFLSYKRGELELRSLKKVKQSSFIKTLVKKVKKETRTKKRVINYFVKTQMFNFINQIHTLSFEMFNIRLEIMAKQKKLLYQNKKLLADRSRGSDENVNRKIDQYFWDFKGAFWADELGDYSFGLKSNCNLNDKNGGRS